jgi:hypothetical protein
MEVPRTEASPDHEDYLTREEIQDVLYELERLGFVKRTGEFLNESPAFVAPFQEMKQPNSRLMGGEPQTHGRM